MEHIKLKKVATVITGHPFKGNSYSSKGLRVVRGENVTEGALRWDTVKCWNLPFDKKDEYSLQKDDIVIGMDGSKVGKNKARIKKNELPLLLAQRVACVRSKNNTNQIFLYYTINNPRFEDYVYRTQTGSSVPHISKSQIEDFEIPIHSLKSQNQIAKTLADLDAKIEINNRINTELEGMAKLIYDYWFVQFDFPISAAQAQVMGKAELEGKPYKSSGGKMVYNEELKREIPEGWEVGYVENVLSKESRTKKLKTSEYLNSGLIPIIDQSTDFICGYTNEKAAMIQADVPRIIFGDHTRILKLINFDFARGADGTQVLLSNNKSLPQHVFFHSLLKIDLSNYGYARHYKFLKQSKIIIPELLTSIEFEKLANSFYKKIRHNIFENKQLSSLRDWLLPILMNGQVKVGEVAEDLSMAAEPEVNYGG